MYNLFILGNYDTLADGVFTLPQERVFEYTDHSLNERYKALKKEDIDEIKQWPALFCAECQEIPTRLGYITKISVRPGGIRVEFEPRSCLSLPKKIEKDLWDLFDIGKFEFNRTHWALKDVDLFDVLRRKEFVSEEDLRPFFRTAEPVVHGTALPRLAPVDKKSVFVVHGRDIPVRGEVVDTLYRLGLRAIVLDEQPNAGRGILDKFLEHSDVDYAVIIYTPCDKGMLFGKKRYEPRARQNVIFEHGFFVGKLGKQNVMLLVKDADKLEIPSDVVGIGYTALDKIGEWKKTLKLELETAGIL